MEVEKMVNRNKEYYLFKRLLSWNTDNMNNKFKLQFII